MPNRLWPWAERCRLFADTVNELHTAAQLLGMKPEWVRKGVGLDWYDLTRLKRLQAIEQGAVELKSFAESAAQMEQCREAWKTERGMVGKTGKLF